MNVATILSTSAGTHTTPSKKAAIVYAGCVLAYVTLTWSFRYLPTWDGPLHLASAVTWARFDEPNTRYREFYVFAPKQVPNLTSQFALAGLVRLMHPLIAEKVLMTVYIGGVAAAFWYFAKSFRGDAEWLAPLGLLFLFHRAFFIGLYNYCLSLIALWFVVGYCVRRSTVPFSASDTVKLAAVLLLAYATHLVGWILSIIAAFWFASFMSEHRLRNLMYLAAAAAPSSLLALDYAIQTSMAGPHGVPTILMESLRCVSATGMEERLASLGANVFGPLAPENQVFACVVFVAYEVMIAAAVLGECNRGRTASGMRALVLAGLLFAGYFLLPDQLPGHGGLLVVRLAFLPPMLVIGLLRLPRARVARRAVLAFVYGLLVANLASAAHFFRVANADIEEYVAGADAVGKNAAIFTAAPSEGSYWPEHLRHAAGYYCLTTGNVALENFQGAPGPFWIQFRRGVVVCRGDFEHYLNKSLVDDVLVWHDRPYPLIAPAGCREVFSQGRLHVFAHRAKER